MPGVLWPSGASSVSEIELAFHLKRPNFRLDVELKLPSQGITALFGPSGSGKTTLLRCIAGLEAAPQGRLVVDGETWQDGKHFLPTHRRPIAYVFQEASLFSHLTVLGNLRYGLKRSPDASEAQLAQAIELLGIGHLLERKCDGLSGGERQRVAIARALAVRPRLMLMDEPLAALDLRRKQEILPYLSHLHQALQLPILYVSHAADEVARLAHHLVALNEGQVVGAGPLREVLTRLDLPIRLGEDAGCILEATVGKLESEWHLVRVDFDGGSLWARDPGLQLGQGIRARVLARDVSLATERGTSSIQNTLRGEVDAMGEDEHPGILLVRVRVGAWVLLARLTKRAAASLKLHPGKELWVQVKSVALLV